MALNPVEQINLIGKLADLKEQHYNNTLMIAAIVELLVEKGLINAPELHSKLEQLDASSLPPMHPNR